VVMVLWINKYCFTNSNLAIGNSDLLCFLCGAQIALVVVGLIV